MATGAGTSSRRTRPAIHPDVTDADLGAWLVRCKGSRMRESMGLPRAGFPLDGSLSSCEVRAGRRARRALPAWPRTPAGDARCRPARASRPPGADAPARPRASAAGTPRASDSSGMRSKAKEAQWGAPRPAQMCLSRPRYLNDRHRGGGPSLVGVLGAAQELAALAPRGGGLRPSLIAPPCAA